MYLKGVYKRRIKDDLAIIDLLKQLFPIKDSIEDCDLVLEMAIHNLTPIQVIDKFDSEFIESLGENASVILESFKKYLAEYVGLKEYSSLEDVSVANFCHVNNISADTALDALNQWLIPQLKYELTECF